MWDLGALRAELATLGLDAPGFPAPEPGPRTPPAEPPAAIVHLSERGARRPVGPVPDFAGTVCTEKMRRASGARRVLAVLWDPHRPEHPAPPAAEIDRLLFGPRPSVADWYV